MATRRPPRRWPPAAAIIIAAVFITAVPHLAAAQNAVKDKSELQRAIDWLTLQRGKDWGWGTGTDTAQAIVAMEMTKTGGLLERELSAKQLEIELLARLWQHHDPDSVTLQQQDDEDEALTVANIATYSMALASACHDPRQFHGHDLIGSLLQHETISDLDFSYSSLVACESGTHVRKRHIRRLMEIANTKHTVDSLSVAILALQCVEHDHRNRNVKPLLKKPLATLIALQQLDGGFGSLHTTALAIRALQEGKATWNRTNAVDWLLNHQGPDGAFFDVATTAEVIIALARVSGVAEGIADHCEVRPGADKDNVGTAVIIPHPSAVDTKRTMSVNVSEPVATDELHLPQMPDSGTNVTVSYSLWIGSNITEKRSINITADHNVTFYEIMQRASDLDSAFTFSATEWPNGHYVHTLSGLKEEPMSYHFWLLYKLRSCPDPQNPPSNQLVAPTGVDDLIVQNGEHYLFWYKKL
ncbi:PREDICTED: uncharacterized protein CG3556 [Diuraphis noxia]|uniref:uncharacterized protein CG3556 n=1 Tax=Diuraphis noxia TaxID=143948 RepID=UPI000763613A|nr:PREDICTED: uncharacterized protein CG3556 [Diuraphis noxia]